MRSPLIISVLLHVTFITLVVFGLPSVSRKTIDLGPIIEVEVITSVPAGTASARVRATEPLNSGPSAWETVLANQTAE